MAKPIETEKTQNFVPVSQGDEFFAPSDLVSVGRQAAERAMQRVLAEMEELQREKKWEELVATFHPAEEKAPELVVYGMDAQVRAGVAFAMGQVGRFDEAISELLICVEKEPDNFRYHSFLAYTAYDSLYAALNRRILLTGKSRADRVTLAHTHFKKAQALRPAGVTNFYREGMLFRRLEGKTVDALPLFLRAVSNWDILEDTEKERRHQERKNYIKALYQSASSLLETGRGKEALEALKRCMREDCFARQWAERGEMRQGYVPVRRPMNLEDVEEHLKGTKTYGIYLLRSDATVGTAVIDMDLNSKYRSGKISAGDRRKIKREALWSVSRFREICGEKGLCPLVEFSGGKGFHFWFFFRPPVEAGRARRMIGQLVGELQADITTFGFEVFPKQDGLSGKGLGNLVKLPLGIHRLSGKRSRFTDCAEKGLEGQLAFPERVQVIGPERLKEIAERAVSSKVVVHPRMRGWAGTYPELAVLEKKCPPLGQIIAACREGKAIGTREEKVLFQVVGFLGRAKALLQQLFASDPEYNPHLVDYRLSRLRGKPLGCKRIHRLLQYEGAHCPFDPDVDYAHPLLHVNEWDQDGIQKAEKVENLGTALENLKLAISQVQRFLR